MRYFRMFNRFNTRHHHPRAHTQGRTGLGNTAAAIFSQKDWVVLTQDTSLSIRNNGKTMQQKQNVHT